MVNYTVHGYNTCNRKMLYKGNFTIRETVQLPLEWPVSHIALPYVNGPAPQTSLYRLILDRCLQGRITTKSGPSYNCQATPVVIV